MDDLSRLREELEQAERRCSEAMEAVIRQTPADPNVHPVSDRAVGEVYVNVFLPALQAKCEAERRFRRERHRIRELERSDPKLVVRRRTRRPMPAPVPDSREETVLRVARDEGRDPEHALDCFRRAVEGLAVASARIEELETELLQLTRWEAPDGRRRTVDASLMKQRRIVYNRSYQIRRLLGEPKQQRTRRTVGGTTAPSRPEEER